MTSSVAQTTPGASVKNRVSSEEWRVRIDLAAFYRLGAPGTAGMTIFSTMSRLAFLAQSGTI